MKTGPIIIIENDAENREIFQSAVRDLHVANKLISFEDGDTALHYLCTTSDQPFIIFSDVNLPKLNGIDFKKKIDADKYLRKKSYTLCVLYHFDQYSGYK